MKYKPDIKVIREFSDIDTQTKILDQDTVLTFLKKSVDDLFPLDEKFRKLSEKEKIKRLNDSISSVNEETITPNTLEYPTYIWGKYDGIDIYKRLVSDKIENEENDIINYSLLKYYIETNDLQGARSQLNNFLEKIDKNPDTAYLIEFCKIYQFNDFDYIQFLEDCHEKCPNNHVVLHMLALNHMHDLNINKVEHYLGLINDNLDFQIEFTNQLYYRLDEVVIERLEQRLDYSNICKVISIIEYWNFGYFLESDLQINQSFYLEKYRKQSVENARTEERDKIIASLSHSIKNIIASVIDPLTNLQKEEKYRPKIIKDAIRGTQLIREMVTAINYSYKGSIEDFYSDAVNNIDNDSITITQMISEALKISIENMFDSKYHSKFLRNYFPNRRQFETAKSKWEAIEEKFNENQLRAFAKRHMFNMSINLDDVCNLKIGNKNGSAIKLSILFQELLLNAVKYSSFVNSENRFINLVITDEKNRINIKIENSFRPNLKSKTSGLGQTVINNFAKMLESQAMTIKNDEKNVYSVEFSSPNFWKSK
jgi:hypothetical protein